MSASDRTVGPSGRANGSWRGLLALALVVALLFYVKSPRFRSSGGAEEQVLMQELAAPGQGPRRFEAAASAASRHAFELRRTSTALK